MRRKNISFQFTIAILLGGCACQSTTNPQYKHPDHIISFQLYDSGAARNIKWELKDEQGAIIPLDGSESILGDTDKKYKIECVRYPPSELTQNSSATPGKPEPAPKPELAPFAVAALSWIITQASNWVVNAADSKLQAEIQKYSTTKSMTIDKFHWKPSVGPVQEAPFDLYGSLVNSQDGKVCLRMQTYDVTNVDGTMALSSDFLALIERDKARSQFLKIQPIRLYYHRASIKSGDGGIAVIFKLTADATALARTRAVTTNSVIENTLAAEKFNVTDDLLVTKPVIKTGLPKSNDNATGGG